MVTGKHRQGQPRSLPGKWEREVVVWPFSLVHRTRNKIKGGGKRQRQKGSKGVGSRGSYDASERAVSRTCCPVTQDVRM